MINCTGTLKSVGIRRLGIYSKIEFFQCKDCKTDFPRINDSIMCNGKPIIKCPWCREDSKPWQNGRGI